MMTSIDLLEKITEGVCVLCTEPMIAGDDLFEDGAGVPYHRACFFRLAAGSLAHQLQVCTCFDPTSKVAHQPSWMTRRQAAEEAMKFFQGRHELTADQLRTMLLEEAAKHE